MSEEQQRIDELASAAFEPFGLDPDSTVDTVQRLGEPHLPRRGTLERARASRCGCTAPATGTSPRSSPSSSGWMRCATTRSSRLRRPSRPGRAPCRLGRGTRSRRPQRGRVRVAAGHTARPRRRPGGDRAVQDARLDLSADARPRPPVAQAGRLHAAALGLRLLDRAARPLGPLAGRPGHRPRRARSCSSDSMRRSRRGSSATARTRLGSDSCTPTSASRTCWSTATESSSSTSTTAGSRGSCTTSRPRSRSSRTIRAYPSCARPGSRDIARWPSSNRPPRPSSRRS